MTMKPIFYIMGKSASGKDTIYEELLADRELALSPIIMYTTRPIRAKEKDGVDYHFTDEAGYQRLAQAGRVIEMREYQTVFGPWKYFTVDESGIEETEEKGPADREGGDAGQRGAGGEAQPMAEDTVRETAGRGILGIGTLESYKKIREYYGSGRVVPLYIEVDDGIRLERALKRERKPGNQKYEEMCRRFLADQADFSEERLLDAGIVRRYNNDRGLDDCVGEIRETVLGVYEGI